MKNGFTWIELPAAGIAVLLALLISAPGRGEVTEAQPFGAELQWIKRDLTRAGDDGPWVLRQRPVRWEADKTVLIICDMWDNHWCKSATSRAMEVAVPINALAENLRKRGVTIIHAPSDVVGYYDDTPARKRARSTPPAANPPQGLDQWCHSIPAEEKAQYPIDQSDGGCDDLPPCKDHRAWTRQIGQIRIDQERDLITDSGVEIWNIMAARGIERVILVGVHTNMCVLGRPFGLRQMVRNGRDVVLVRDLTDTMYNPRAKPFVNHFRGTALIVEHIEKYICPTVSSEQVLGGQPFQFAGERAAAATPKPADEAGKGR